MANDTYGFASKAQVAKWRQMVHEGRLTETQFRRREQATPVGALPDRLSPRRRTVGKSRAPDAAKLGKHRY